MEKQNLKLRDHKKVLNHKTLTRVHRIWSKQSPFANSWAKSVEKTQDFLYIISDENSAAAVDSVTRHIIWIFYSHRN